MDNLKKQKSENKLSENIQARLYTEKMKNDRKYFQYADISQSLLESQKDDDLMLLQEAFLKWINGLSQDDARRKELTLLLQSIWRIQSYCGSLETICKASTVAVYQAEEKTKFVESEFKILKLKSIQDNKNYEKEIGGLKEQIAFIEKASQS